MFQPGRSEKATCGQKRGRGGSATTSQAPPAAAQRDQQARSLRLQGSAPLVATKRPGGIWRADLAGKGPDIGDIALGYSPSPANWARKATVISAVLPARVGFHDAGIGQARQGFGRGRAIAGGDVGIEGLVDFVRQKRLQAGAVARREGLEDHLIGRAGAAEEMAGLEAGVGQLDVEQAARLGLGWPG